MVPLDPIGLGGDEQGNDEERLIAFNLFKSTCFADDGRPAVPAFIVLIPPNLTPGATHTAHASVIFHQSLGRRALAADRPRCVQVFILILVVDGAPSITLSLNTVTATAA